MTDKKIEIVELPCTAVMVEDGKVTPCDTYAAKEALIDRGYQHVSSCRNDDRTVHVWSKK